MQDEIIIDIFVSRQAAIEEIRNLKISVAGKDIFPNETKETIIKTLDELPSVQPKSEDAKFLEFLMNTINPNEMEQYLAMYHSKEEKMNG